MNAHALIADDDRRRDRFTEATTSSRRAQALVRWNAHGSRLVGTFASLYADAPRFDVALQRLLTGMAACVNARSDALRALDDARERDPDWFLAQDMIGYCTYADRFGGDLRGVAERVPYLQGLGIRYLHLLPFLHAREGDNDGRFAVRDYDTVDPSLGTDDDLDALTAQLRNAGISLCADLVLNHTADDHRWAEAARAGDAHHLAYYHVFPDRILPDAYERDLHQVFPQTAPGNFTHVPTLGWVWTTFYGYQWDLNWSNPDVFVEMALTMLRMANRGIEAFRLDSTAYLWKRLGTDCMNQSEAHAILQALRAVSDIVAPGVLLKAEAIVPARELPPYFGNGESAGRECHLAYHSTLMAALWVALAEQRGDLLAEVIANTPALPGASGWLIYLRCHDDIGWNVLREEAEGRADLAPFDLARIARFYAGDTDDSFARGRSFQSAGGDHVHGTNGMASALAGIADAQARGDAGALALAEQRLLLLYGIVFAAAGLPALYMGDEIALDNDEAYIDDPLRAAEGRWLHRPAMDWTTAEGLDALHDIDTTAARIKRALRRMIAVRRSTPDLRGDVPVRALDFAGPALLGLARGNNFVALFNLSAVPVTTALPAELAGTLWRDMLSDDEAATEFPVALAPYALRWLRRG
jgi:amylosucrase